MRFLFVAIFALALGGCETTSAPPPVILPPPDVQPRALKDEIPQSAMICAAEPAGTAVQTERQAAQYIEDVRSAGRDCRRKLGVVRTLIQGEQR